VKRLLKRLYRAVVPHRLQRLCDHVSRFGAVRGLMHLYRATHPPRRLRFGSFRRLQPISRSFGMDRGKPVDRHYIEGFLARHSADIRGRVLEAGGFVSYTRKFGQGRVTRADVLYVKDGFPDATIVGDLATGHNIPGDAFDCIILTQVFPFIFDLPAAITHTRRALRPGGVLLATLPGISQVCRHDMVEWGDYWRVTDMAARRLFEAVFGPEHVAVGAHGNVLAACAFLQGLATRDLHPGELDVDDPDYPLIITVRAVRAASAQPAAVAVEPLRPARAVPAPALPGARP
jgi:hypothetical protein